MSFSVFRISLLLLLSLIIELQYSGVTAQSSSVPPAGSTVGGGAGSTVSGGAGSTAGGGASSSVGGGAGTTIGGGAGSTVGGGGTTVGGGAESTANGGAGGSTTMSDEDNDDDDKEKNKTVAIVVGIIGGVIALALILWAMWMCCSGRCYDAHGIDYRGQVVTVVSDPTPVYGAQVSSGYGFSNQNRYPVRYSAY